MDQMKKIERRGRDEKMKPLHFASFEVEVTLKMILHTHQMPTAHEPSDYGGRGDR